MPIRIKCKHCGRGIKAADEWAGKDGTCPSCGGAITIPLPPAVATLPAPLEIDEPPANNPPDVEPFHSRSRTSYFCLLISAFLFIVAIGQMNDYAASPFEKSENVTNGWRLLCASWGFVVLAAAYVLIQAARWGLSLR